MAASLDGRAAGLVVAADSRPNATAACVLGFLDRQAMTGWELARCIGAEVDGVWNVTRSQVYRELHALERSGLVSAGVPGPRDRRPYAITEAGRAAFRDWLSRHPEDDVVRSPLGLAVFFASCLDRTLLQRFLEMHRVRHEQRLADREAARAALERSGDADPWALDVCSFGIEYERTVLRWIDGVAARAGRPESVSGLPALSWR